MKHYIFFFVSALLIGCSTPKSPIRNTDTETPISPIQYMGQTTHISLTNYLPELTGEEQLTLETDLNYIIDNYTLLEFDITGDNTIGTLTIYVDSTTQYDICILPNLPTQQSLACTYKEGNIIQFKLLDKVDQLQVHVYLDNRLLPSSVVSCNEGDETLTITIPEDIRGNSTLHVYVTTREYICSEILIPLEDGHVVNDTH